MTPPLILPGAFLCQHPRFLAILPRQLFNHPLLAVCPHCSAKDAYKLFLNLCRGFGEVVYEDVCIRHVHRPVLWAVCFLDRTRGALALNQLCCSSSAAPRSGDAGRWQRRHLELVAPFAVVGPLLDGLRAASCPLLKRFRLCGAIERVKCLLCK